MKRTLKVIQLLMFSLLILTFGSIVVQASENYEILQSKINVPVNKIWAIKFNKSLNYDSVKGKVKILDEKDSLVDLDTECESNTLIVKPRKNYELGKTYTLIVDKDIQSETGSTLDKPLKMDFEIEKPKDSDIYNLINPHTYEIEDSITVSADEDSYYKLKFNMGSLSDSPYQKELGLGVEGAGMRIITAEDGSKQAVAEGTVKSGERIQYKITKKVVTSGIEYKVDLSNTSENYSEFSDYEKYTSPEPRIDSNDGTIIAKSRELLSGIDNPYLKAKKAYEFVNSYMTYDLDSKYSNQGALSALKTGRGDCEDYSDLYVALLRASGVPSRVVTGYWVTSEIINSPFDASTSRHAWVEFYLPTYGWIVAEPTNTYIYNGEKRINYDFFAKLKTPSHFIRGYNAAGDNSDGSYLIMYDNKVKVYYQDQIIKLD